MNQTHEAETMELVSIRALHPEAWAAYKQLRLEALEREPQAFGASYAEAIEKPDSYWRERLEAVDSVLGPWMLFAESAGSLVGMAGAYADEHGVIWIISVYVTASERGCGVARRLMEAVLGQIASTSAVTRVSLMVNKSQSIAVALYSSLGFRVKGEVPVTLGDGNLHEEYIMEKALALENNGDA